jgi:hypothetical protein
MALAAPLGSDSGSAVGSGLNRHAHHLIGAVSFAFAWRKDPVPVEPGRASAFSRTCWAAWLRTAWAWRWAASATACWPPSSRCTTVTATGTARLSALPPSASASSSCASFCKNHQPFRRLSRGHCFAIDRGRGDDSAVAGRSAVDGHGRRGHWRIGPLAGLSRHRRGGGQARSRSSIAAPRSASIPHSPTSPSSSSAPSPGPSSDISATPSVFLFALISVLAALGIVIVLRQMQRRGDPSSSLRTGSET